MTIAVDFDGTLVTHEYPMIGKPIPFAIETLIKLQKELHCNIILWTYRTGKTLDEAVEYCRSKGLEFYAVNKNYPEEEDGDKDFSRKINADIYIDDRNLGGLPDWGVIYAVIKGQTKPVYDDAYILHKPKKNWLIRLGERLQEGQ
ncbi:MAG: hypothetical protein MJ007_05480 [Paludibacteraceae bacterium]|nr:hypothetical protein [Paludibacteraceae bacterium]